LRSVAYEGGRVGSNTPAKNQAISSPYPPTQKAIGCDANPCGWVGNKTYLKQGG
jgi:hypothetical protein